MGRSRIYGDIPPWELMGISRQRWYQLKKKGEAFTQRASGLVYENPPERIEELKKKYSDGVPSGEVEAWIMGL